MGAISQVWTSNEEKMHKPECLGKHTRELVEKATWYYGL